MLDLDEGLHIYVYRLLAMGFLKKIERKTSSDLLKIAQTQTNELL